MGAWGGGPGISECLFRQLGLQVVKVKRIGRGGSGAVQLDWRAVLTQLRLWRSRPKRHVDKRRAKRGRITARVSRRPTAASQAKSMAGPSSQRARRCRNQLSHRWPSWSSQCHQPIVHQRPRQQFTICERDCAELEPRAEAGIDIGREATGANRHYWTCSVDAFRHASAKYSN